MTWDAHRFRIEVGEVLMVNLDGDTVDLQPQYGADIWLMEDGKVTSRKKLGTMVDDSIPALLRMLAVWIEEHDDPGLRQLIAQFKEAKGG